MRAMASHSFVRSAAVELETIAAMTEAFDAACKQLDDTGQPESVLEIIAERIIAAAKLGERHPSCLRKAALAGLPGEED
jgi:hypothetical protein